jgi:dTDP-4-amino-4,6-dideoxygalactose transaminase
MNLLPAILGGDLLLDERCQFVRPSMPAAADLVQGLAELEKSRVLSNQGTFVRALEERVAAEVGAPYCAAFASGTIALMCLARALDLKGEVVLPSFTFAATAQALSWQGLRPRFVDIDPRTLHMTPELAEAAITPETTALLPVNLFGSCGRLDDFEALAQRRGLRLLFDSAQAFGARFRGRPVGTFGDAEVLSFHATKAFHTGEGGAVVTRSRELYERLCRIRNYGFENYLNCIELGMNGKMAELPALVGLHLLRGFPEVVAARRRAVAEYGRGLQGLPGLRQVESEAPVTPSPAYFAMHVDREVFGLNAIELNYALMAERIVTRCYFYPPVHRTTYYQRVLGADTPNLPATDAAATSTLCLPLHAQLTPETISTVVLAVRRIHDHAPAIRRALKDKVPTDWDTHSASRYRDPYDVFFSDRRPVPAPEPVPTPGA